jgi:putative glutamine amidotransferase
MRSAPVIAIPTYHLPVGRVSDWARAGYALPAPYVDAVRRAGGRPVLIPAPFDGVPDVCDALVLAGGGDIEPARYGDAAGAHPAVYGVDPARDELELALAVEAVAAGVPTLAICRGFQVVNVAFGGTLLPHLPDVDGLRAHGTPVLGDSVRHDVKVAGSSMLERLCGSDVRGCVSHHHQGADRVGHGLVPVAWADDGLVEALELAPDAGGGAGGAGPFFVAVQWHPEMSAATDPVQQGLFNALVEAAARR